MNAEEMREEMNASFEHMQDFVKVPEVWRGFSIGGMHGWYTRGMILMLNRLHMSILFKKMQFYDILCKYDRYIIKKQACYYSIVST